ncbi:integrase, catalytic region, zinc finger, CCHC-type containing protein, partial [Tanacetum coccineum]
LSSSNTNLSSSNFKKAFNPNNQAEYEALLAGLRIAKKIRVQSMSVNVDSKLVASQYNGNYEACKENTIRYMSKAKEYISCFKNFNIQNIPRNKNQKADILSKLASVAFNHLTKEILVETLDMPSMDVKEINTIVEEEGETRMTPIINCLERGVWPEDQNKANYVICEIHMGACNMHLKAGLVVAKAIQQGYYWPTMHQDAREEIRKCDSCQIHALIPKLPKTLMTSIMAPWPFFSVGNGCLGTTTKIPRKRKKRSSCNPASQVQDEKGTILQQKGTSYVLQENGVTMTKKYEELFATKKIQADCDLKATNIILQGLPYDVYSLVNYHIVAKDLWERVQLLMQGTSLTKQERECKLYDAFDKFTHIKGESHQYYLRFTQLINDMNIYKMKLEQFQVNTKFLNSLPPEWSKFVTHVKLVRDLHTTNFDQLHAYLEQHELHANIVCIMRERNQDPFALVIDSGLAVLVFKQGDDPIDAINKMMPFLSTVVTSRVPTTNKGDCPTGLWETKSTCKTVPKAKEKQDANGLGDKSSSRLKHQDMALSASENLERNWNLVARP